MELLREMEIVAGNKKKKKGTHLWVSCREREERNGVVERNGDCGGEEEKEKRARILAPVVNHPRPNM